MEMSEGSDDIVSVRVSGERDREFSAFAEQAGPVLGRMAWLLCGDVHRAEELVQQTLIRTYMAWSRARQTDPIAYARRTLANLRIDAWRKVRHERLTAPEALPDHPTPSVVVAHGERDALVRGLLRLPLRRRQVLVLRYLMDMSEREVAADLDISLGTVKSTAARALSQLRSILDGQAASSAEEEKG